MFQLEHPAYFISLISSLPTSQDGVEDILMLRSLKDVNLPKFLAPDIPLFEGILSDLFPGVDLPQADYTQLDAGLLSNCERLSLQPTEVFIEKVFRE